jgi:hypothetical protein
VELVKRVGVGPLDAISYAMGNDECCPVMMGMRKLLCVWNMGKSPVKSVPAQVPCLLEDEGERSPTSYVQTYDTYTLADRGR